MKVVIAIGGASGSIYARVLLDKLMEIPNLEIAMVLSKNAALNWELENENFPLGKYPFLRFENDDYAAPFASGSGKYDAMIICPCSAGQLGRIANGLSDDLISRAADVMLKERKKLVLVFRESPLSLIHLENMRTVTLAGAVICPAIPSFYSKPNSMDDLAATVSNRALELIGLDTKSFRWGAENK